MKINSIKQTQSQTNFQGAYIIKGSVKSVNRFTQEIGIQSLMNKKTPEVMLYELTEFYSESQPYAEVLVGTGSHITNIKNKQRFDEMVKFDNMKRFIKDFQNWSEEKKTKLKNGFIEALKKIQNGEIEPECPGEKELEKGNSDKFLDWYSDTIKSSNQIYNKTSRLGPLNFPAKIRRLDADKAADALISGNFNIKEGFFRQQKNPKVEIEYDNNDNTIIRYVNGKIDSVLEYTDLSPEDNLKMLQTYRKLYYDKNGNLCKSTVQDYFGDFINTEKYNR